MEHALGTWSQGSGMILPPFPFLLSSPYCHLVPWVTWLLHFCPCRDCCHTPPVWSPVLTGWGGEFLESGNWPTYIEGGAMFSFCTGSCKLCSFFGDLIKLSGIRWLIWWTLYWDINRVQFSCILIESIVSCEEMQCFIWLSKLSRLNWMSFMNVQGVFWKRNDLTVFSTS